MSWALQNTVHFYLLFTFSECLINNIELVFAVAFITAANAGRSDTLLNINTCTLLKSCLILVNKQTESSVIIHRATVHSHCAIIILKDITISISFFLKAEVLLQSIC